MENSISKKRGFKFLTNFKIKEIDQYELAAKKTNEYFGFKAISISKTSRDKTEESGSVWYSCDTEQLQIFHEISDEQEILSRTIETNIGKVVVSKFFQPSVGEFCVYSTEKGDIVYNIVGSEGSGKDHKKILESNGRQERFYISGEELTKIKKIEKPTGYINC